MKQIHSINLKLRIYFKGGINRQPQELFINPDEDNDITTQDTALCEVTPTAEELAQIEAEIQEGKIQVWNIRDKDSWAQSQPFYINGKGRQGFLTLY